MSAATGMPKDIQDFMKATARGGQLKSAYKHASKPLRKRMLATAAQLADYELLRAYVQLDEQAAAAVGVK